MYLLSIYFFRDWFLVSLIFPKFSFDVLMLLFTQLTNLALVVFLSTLFIYLVLIKRNLFLYFYTLWSGTFEALVYGNAFGFPKMNFSVTLLDNIAFRKYFIVAFDLLISFVLCCKQIFTIFVFNF